MQGQHQSIVVSILRKDFPDIAAIIDARINDQMPEQILTDLSMVTNIIKDFKDIFIHAEADRNVQWKQSTARIWCRLSSDEYRFCKVTEIREMLIAVILMFYYPDRILGMNKSKAPYGFAKELSKLLGCWKQDVSTSLISAITYYRSYAGFKEEVLNLYEAIKIKGNYFKPVNDGTKEKN